MSRALASALLLLAIGATPAWADAPPGASATPAPAATPAAPPVAAGRGVIVVAVADDARDAARALAYDVYRDAALRPEIDDATARVLAGGAPPDGAPKLKDLAEARAAIATAGNGAAGRRLLGSLGTELGAQLVVAVSVESGRPVARILKPAASSFERLELGAAIETSPDGPATVKWPGATLLLRGIVAPKSEPLRPVAKPVAPPPPPPAKEKALWSSPWFWGALGGVAAVGVTVFVLSKTTSADDGTVHLSGHVAP